MLEIGSSLQEARRRRNLDLAEVERATRIRIRQLEALEHERFDLLPPDPYRRSFLREYADFLGLDGDLYASEYDLRFRPHEPATPPPPPPRRTYSRAWPLGRRPLLPLSAIAVVVLVAVAAWQLGRPGSTTVPPPPAPTTAAHTQAERPRPHKRAASTPATTRPGRTLVLTAARGSCWLWVRLGSSTGTPVYEQTLQPGQTTRFGLRRRLWIRLGAPWNLDATSGARPLALPAKTGDVLATPTGLQPAP